MNRTKHLVFAVIAAFAVTACQPGANTTVNNAVVTNTSTNANSNANSTAAAPTKEALIALDRTAYDAWKNKDAKYWDPVLSAKFVGFDMSGKLDKAAAMKQYAGADCDVKSVSLSDDQMTPLGPNAAMITYKVTTDGTCGGQKLPASSWAASVFVREGSQWKGAFHAESPIRDPSAPPVKAAAAPAKPAATAATTTTSASPDTATDAMFTLEKKAWDAWKNKDAKGLEDFASTSLVAFTSGGRQTKADAIKTWLSGGCEIKSTMITEPSSISLGPDHALLTFRAAADGTCQGVPVPTEYGATVYAKEAGTWKALFTMGSPIM